MCDNIDIVLIGGGGHAKVVIDALRKKDNFKIEGIIDGGLPEGSSVMDVMVLGSDEILPEVSKKGVRYAFISVGSIGNCDARKRIYINLKRLKFQLPVIMHPKAIVAETVKLGEGTFIAPGAVIGPGVEIGKNVKRDFKEDELIEL